MVLINNNLLMVQFAHNLNCLRVQHSIEQIFSNPSALMSNTEENEKFQITSIQNLQTKLPFLTISKTWSVWYPNPHTMIFMRPRFRVGV